MDYRGRYGEYLIESYDGELWGRCEECGKNQPVYDMRDIYIKDDLTTYKFVEAACVKCISKMFKAEGN